MLSVILDAGIALQVGVTHQDRPTAFVQMAVVGRTKQGTRGCEPLDFGGASAV